MGFDNECIPNIQSLAGEYFCPVCRLLVYPDEALQSQCTHLYCKPCLTYIVSTTHACPYDGYLVTEADSKPLIESNKALAETIGKIAVRCLYHRSGCTWQGPLSECTSHCAGCAFGNSPVVCNRCGIQIVHRQVQEHAQNCPGVQVQPQSQSGTAQDTAATGTKSAADQAPAATQAGTNATQPLTSQTTASSIPGQDSNQQNNPTTQLQSAVQTTGPTAEQWYQQQQQYQQYYQQYPGYDPYHQHYQQFYPYQQQAVPQYPQAQVYMQPQPQVQPQAQLLTQPQAHPNIQVAAAAQSQSQPQVNMQQQAHPTTQPQSLLQSQTHPPPHVQPHPQPQLHPQTHPVQPHSQQVQTPQYQPPHTQTQHPQPQGPAQAHSQLHHQHLAPQLQPHSQGLPQTHAQHPAQPHLQSFTSQPNQSVNPHLQPQPQLSSAHAVTGHNSYAQPQPQQQVQLGGPQHLSHMYPQGGPQPQSQHTIQMQGQFPHQPSLLRPPQSHVPIQNAQQSGLLPSPGQTPNVPPAQQQPFHSHIHQPGLIVHQRAVLQSVHQQVQQQYAQQSFSGQAVQNQVPQHASYGQQLHVQSQLRPQGLPSSFQQPSHVYPQSQQNVALPHGMLPYQAQNPGGRPTMLPHGVATQPHPHSPAVMQVRPIQVGAGQQSGNALRSYNPEQDSGASSQPVPERQGDQFTERGSETESTSLKDAKRDPADLGVASGVGADLGKLKNELKRVKSESDLEPVDDDNKPKGEIKDICGAENGEHLLKQVKKEPKDGIDDQKDVSTSNHFASEDKEIKGGPLMRTPPLHHDQLEDLSLKSQDRNVTPQPSHLAPVADHGKQQPPLIPQGHSSLQQRPVGSSLSQAAAPVPPHCMQLPGQPSAPFRPLGSGNIPNSGQPLNPPPEHFQQSQYRPGSEVSPIDVAGQGPTSAFGRGRSHYGPQGPYAQDERTPLYDQESDMFPNQRPNYIDGRRLDTLEQQPGMHPNVMRMNGAPGLDSSSGLGLRDDGFRPLPDDHLSTFPPDPIGGVDRGEFEDLKHFPRPPHMDSESVKKYGSHFPSSRSLDRGPHVFGLDLPPKPLEKGPHSLSYDSGPLGSYAPPRFFPPYHHDGIIHPDEMGERPTGFHDSTVGRKPDSARTRPEFFGPAPRYGHRHMDGLASRSPGRDYPGFGVFPGIDTISGRESRRYGDSFHGNRFPALPGHLHRGEFDGPGQDGFTNRLRRGEHMDPHNLPSHVGEPIGYASSRMGELTGPGNFFHPPFGEPGFRSSFSLKGIPGDGGSYTGDLKHFDSSRRRKSASMGWCRICKVDCETVEGLDLHSQTREHQKIALDMVVSIKKNAKKQKLAPSDHSSLDDASKSRNASSEGRGNKN